jgi:hypothetical protein
MAWNKSKYVAKGFITLVYKNDFIEQRFYDCLSDRKGIIELWEKRYKRQWSNCTFLVNPHTDITRINGDGTNIKWKNKEMVQLENQNPIL